MLHCLGALALGLALDVLAPPGLELRATAFDAMVLAGASSKVTTRWAASEPVEVGFEDAQVFLDAGDGFVRWYEAPRTDALGGVVTGRFRMQPGHAVVMEHVIGVGETERSRAAKGRPYRLAFPRAGTHRVMVRYCARDVCVSSNILTIRVVAPEGQEAEIFQRYIQRDPDILLGWPRGRQQDAFHRWIVRKYPGTRYLDRAKLLHYETQLYEAIRAAPEPARVTDPIQGDVPALLERLEADAFGKSPFEADRLLLLKEMRERTGRATTADAR